MDLELVKHANDYIEKMARGINPLNGENIPEGDLINDVRISRCLFYVNKVLTDVLSSKKIKSIKEIPFNISEEDLYKYEYEETINISNLVKKINELKDNANMADLKRDMVRKWLLSIGVLKEVEINNRKRNIPTETGKNLGISMETRFGLNGAYEVVMYNKKAQEFIINNFSCCLDFINKN